MKYTLTRFASRVVSPRFAALLLSCAAGAFCFASPTLAGNLIVDSGLDQNGNPGNSSPYTQTSGSASYDSAYVCAFNSGVVYHSGGTLSLSGTLYLNYAGANNATGTYNLSGTGVLSAQYEYAAYANTGTFNQTGGTNNVSNTLAVGQGTNVTGSYNLSAGSLSAPIEYIGEFGGGTFTQTGGTNTVSNTLYLGYQSGSGYTAQGTYTLTGGVLQTAKVARGAGTTYVAFGYFYFDGGTLQAGADSTTFMQGLTQAIVENGGAKIDTNGHNITIAQPLTFGGSSGALTKLGNGTLTLTASNGFVGGTTFSGGVVSVGSDLNLGNFSNGPNPLAFNGGTLQITGTLFSDFSHHTVNTTTFNGGLDIASASNTFTAVPLAGSNLTKAGAGTLTLTGSNSFTGTVSVSAGTLNFGSGATFSSTAINVATGAILDPTNLPSSTLVLGTGQSLGGNGTISGAATIGNGGNLAPGNSVGTVTAAALTLNAGSALSYEFSGGPTPTNDFTNVTGTLTINGGTFYLYDVGTSNPFSQIGSYDVLAYGTLIGPAVNSVTHNVSMSVANPVTGFLYSFRDDFVRKRIVLTIAAAPQAPAFTSANNATFHVGTAGSFTVTTTGYPAPTITASPTPAPPAGITFTDNGDGTATFSGTPAGGSGGAYSFTLTASNGVPPNATQGFTLTVTQAPTFIAGGPPPDTATKGQAYTGYAFAASGYPAPTFSVSPSLPGGLTLNSATGALSGTPTNLGTVTTLVITATNSAGSASTAPFSITVNDAPPSSLSYPTNPAAYTKGQPITNNTPSHNGGAIVSYSISPALPAGLSFNTSTGIISGTPTVLSPAANYTVTATNSGGSATATLSIAVNDLAPSGLTYSANPATYTKGQSITNNTPTSSGGPVVSYAISPAPPGGLSFNTSTGVITGTPTVVSPAANYAVTATNSGGSTTATLSIAVNDVAPSGLTYSTNPATYTKGQTITNNTPTSSGGAVVSYAISPTLPAGLSFNIGTGVIGGTPTVVSPAANYTVTATNSGGSTTATLSMAVNDVAPSGLTYSSNPAIYHTGETIENNTPSNSGGTIASYSIAPALPSGLSFNTSSGLISGTPTVLSPATDYTVSATNSGGSTTAILTITVTVGSATRFTVTAAPNATTNSSITFTVTAQDSYGNTATGYDGIIHFTSTDLQAALPADGTVSSSPGTFSATFEVSGNQTITATDTATSSITGTSNVVTVTGTNMYVVNSTADPGDGVCDTSDCTLREAINAANSASGDTTITFDATVFAGTHTITLSGSELVIGGNGMLTISGPAANRLTISGNNASRVIHVLSGANLSLNGVTVTGGNGVGGGSRYRSGGGLYNEGTLTVADCAVSGNSASADSFQPGRGGGIENDANLTVVRSTISGNTSSGQADAGGGIANTGNLSVTNSTLSGNNAFQGAGLYQNNGFGNSATVSNTTISGNNGGQGPGIYHQNGSAVGVSNSIIANVEARDLGLVAFSSGGYNIINGGNATGRFGATGDRVGIDPRLGPFGFNGGTTQTYSLLAGSPALDSGNNPSLTTDQRGLLRPIDGDGDGTAATDIGAYERQTAQPVDLAISQSAPGSATSGQSFIYTLTVTNTGTGNVSAVRADFAVPSGVTYNSNATTSGFSSSYDSTANAVHFTDGTLNAGSSATLTITVTAGAVGTITSDGSGVVVDPADIIAESNEGNNIAATVTTSILSPANVSGTKTVSGSFNPGSTVTYTIVLSNSGPAAELDNPGSEFTDVLPGGLSLASASATSGTAAANTGSNTVTWNGSIASSGSVTITIQAVINNAAAGTTITNQGSIAYDADGNGTNEGSALTDDPNVSGTSNPTSFVAHSAPAITSANNTTFKVGTPGSFNVTTSGVPSGPGMSITETGFLPGGVTFVNNNDGTATLSGTPNANTGAIYQITITGSNGTAPNASQNLTLTVVQAPAITSANSTAFQTGIAGNFMVTTTGFPTEASMSITQSGELPSGVTFVNNNNGTATLAGTPVAGTAGNYPFTIGVNNGVTPTTNQNFTLIVTGSGPSPTPSPTPTATATPTATPAATPTATPTATASASPTPSPSATPTPTPAQALNISTRLRVETGDNAMIGGFIIMGNTSKPVVLRGMGPSLVGAGVPAAEVLNDPVLELHGPNGSLITTNDNWKESPQRSQIEGTIYQPTDDRESVIVATLQPGAYTATLTGSGQTTGIGVVEIYDNSQTADSALANISTRGSIQTGNDVLIGGFALGGNNNPARIAIRGLGPSLAQSGLNQVLADPVLQLHDGNGAVMISNDNWTDDPVPAAELSANGLAPQNGHESGIFVSLPPGQFTVILSGKDNSIGIGLLEIYNLQ